MEYQYKCVKDLELPWHDEEEHITEKRGTVKQGSVWELGAHRGEQPIRLLLRAGDSDFSYIDISLEMLRVHFQEIERIMAECKDCKHCNSRAYHSGKWYCKSPKVSIFKPPLDFSGCFEPRGKHGGKVAHMAAVDELIGE